MSIKNLYSLHNKCFIVYLEFIKPTSTELNLDYNNILSNYICFKPVYDTIRELEQNGFVFQNIEPAIMLPNEVDPELHSIMDVIALFFIPPSEQSYLFGAIKVKQIDLESITMRALN